MEVSKPLFLKKRHAKYELYFWISSQSMASLAVPRDKNESPATYLFVSIYFIPLHMKQYPACLVEKF